MPAGLRTAYTRVAGDPEALPIMSARASDLARLVDQDPDDAERWEFTLPANALAFELSVINGGENVARMKYLAGPAQADADDGLERVVPAAGQLIEYRHAVAEDKLVVEIVGAEDVEVIVHAHIGGSA